MANASGSNIVNLESVSKAYGTTSVFSDLSIGVTARDRIGVVGRNGDGKSTLLKLIIGTEQPDSGRVTRTGGVTIATVDQQVVEDERATVRDLVVGDAATHEWAGDSTIRDVLSGLGLSKVGLDSVFGRLSGGERRRVALAAALVRQTDLLVLDEPTNHLDVEGITWLAGYLNDRLGASRSLLVVTHDRWFLDAVCSRMWEVADETVRPFAGGYAAYVLARAERARQADASESRRQNLMRKELAWLRRGPPARTSKPQFRIDAAEALIADVPPARSGVELRALAQKRLGRTVFGLEDVTVKVGSRTLLDNVTWHVGPGDRIGVIGVNGSGKTHLLRLLAGTLTPQSGKVEIGKSVQSAYLSQEVTELPSQMRVIEAVQSVRTSAEIGGVEQSATQLAERFGFANNRQWTPVANLSGGERRRLQLLRLLLTQPNVLLLDEPTNDLDTDTLAALEDLLDSWAGTLVVVSHDRYLIERICDSTVALLGDGSLAALPGGIDEYLARRAASRPTTAATPARPRAAEGSADRAEGDAEGIDQARAAGGHARQARGGAARRTRELGHRLRAGRRTRRSTARGGRRPRSCRGAMAPAVRGLDRLGRRPGDDVGLGLGFGVEFNCVFGFGFVRADAQGGVRVQALQAVPAQIHQMRRHDLARGFAHVQPPLTGECDHSDEHLRVHPSQVRLEATAGELAGQDVLDLIGDVVEQGRERAAARGHRRVTGQDSEAVGLVLDVDQQGQRRLLHHRAGVPLGQRRRDPLRERLHLAVDDDRVQAFLAAEVLVDHRLADPGAGRHLFDRGRLVAALGEQFAADVQQLLAPLGAGHSNPGAAGLIDHG